MTDLFKITLPPNVCKYLSDVFGGTWKHDHMTSWYCDDGRRVSRTGTLDSFGDPNAISSYYLYSKHDSPISVNFDMDHDFCEQSKSEERTFGSTVCVDCNLYEPHVDLTSPTQCEEMYKSGELKKEPDSCSKWLCNCGGCPHSKPRIDRIYKLSMINTDNVASRKSMLNENKETRILTEQDLEHIPEHLREMVRIQNNKNKADRGNCEGIVIIDNSTFMPLVSSPLRGNCKGVMILDDFAFKKDDTKTVIPHHNYNITPLMEKIMLAEATHCSYLPTEVISFNPSDKESVNKLLSKFGPEGLHDIAEVLRDAADKDMDDAMKEFDESNTTN